jgi:adenylosuccinate synthase
VGRNTSDGLVTDLNRRGNPIKTLSDRLKPASLFAVCLFVISGGIVMPVQVVVGAQWGDEGKGKIVDYLSAKSKIVIRFQGGPNAGHTIMNSFGEFKLHSVPSGIFRRETDCIIGAGTVLSPPQFFDEIAELQHAGVSVERLFISDRVNLIMPWHGLREEIEETGLGDRKIGTTGKSIGPAYADRYGRWGICVGDLEHRDWFRNRLSDILKLKNRELACFGKSPFQLDEMLELCFGWYEKLRPFVRDTGPIIQHALDRNDGILLEGQLGIGKGVIWGSYPYVTSSSPTAGGAATGAGIPPHRITDVFGIVKAYSTSVGAGPMVTTDESDIGPRLRKIGHEFGATTGRPRKCGWLDGVVIKHGARINGYTRIAVTRMDILDTIDPIGICVAYERDDGSRIDSMPLTPVLETCRPVMEYMPGWNTSTRACRDWASLPQKAKDYVTRIESFSGAPASIISVGPRREETIFRAGEGKRAGNGF